MAVENNSTNIIHEAKEGDLVELTLQGECENIQWVGGFYIAVRPNRPQVVKSIVGYYSETESKEGIEHIYIDPIKYSRDERVFPGNLIEVPLNLIQSYEILRRSKSD